MADDVITMFDGQGRATSFQHARWKAKGGLQPLQADMILVVKGEATPAYRSIWRASFPNRLPLPLAAVATKAGKFTDAMLDVWL